MLRRIEVKRNKTRWDGAANGNQDLAYYMSENRYSRLVVTRRHLPKGPKLRRKIRHFFTEEGWEYVGKALVGFAAENGIEYRVIEAEEADDLPTLYRDALQVVVAKADITKPRIIKPKAMYAGRQAAI